MKDFINTDCLSWFSCILGCGCQKKLFPCCVRAMIPTSTKSQEIQLEYVMYCDLRCLQITPTGLPHEILTHDFFVPGSCARKENERYKGKDIFSEILSASNDTVLLYFDCVLKDCVFCIFAIFKFQQQLDVRISVAKRQGKQRPKPRPGKKLHPNCFPFSLPPEASSIEP